MDASKIDITEIAQKLIEQLTKQQDDDKLRAEGVVLLHNTVRERLLASQQAESGQQVEEIDEVVEQGETGGGDGATA